MFSNYNFYFPNGKLPQDITLINNVFHGDNSIYNDMFRDKNVRDENTGIAELAFNEEGKPYYNINNWPFDSEESSPVHCGLFHIYFCDPNDFVLKDLVKVNYNITIKKPQGRYYYYILADQYRMNILPVWKENYTNPVKLLLPDEIKKDLDSDKCQIVLDHSLEGMPWGRFELTGWQNLFGEYLQKTIYICGDFKLNLHNMIPTVYRNTFEKHVSRLVGFDKTKLKESIKNRKQRKFKAICKNRVLRSHRLMLCNWLSMENLSYAINYSFGIVTHHGSNDGNRNYDSRMFGNIIEDASIYTKIPEDELTNWANSHGEKNLWHEPKRNLHINLASIIDDPLIEAYADSYFEIVCETNFFEHTIFHSEKSFKPMIFLQPFVIMGEQGIISTLRTFGYDLFDDFIDHTYDAEKDHLKRFELLKIEIRRLISISHKEWADFLYESYDRLGYNIRNLKQSSHRYNTIHNTKYKGQSLDFPADHEKI